MSADLPFPAEGHARSGGLPVAGAHSQAGAGCLGDERLEQLDCQGLVVDDDASEYWIHSQDLIRSEMAI